MPHMLLKLLYYSCICGERRAADQQLGLVLYDLPIMNGRSTTLLGCCTWGLAGLSGDLLQSSDGLKGTLKVF